jgi:osmotically-inducible protein OsmY
VTLAPKGQVSVNAENGVVFLRGALDDATWIERLGAEAERVDGVKAVRNLLHQTGTPAPTAL